LSRYSFSEDSLKKIKKFVRDMSEEKTEVFSSILTTIADSPYVHPSKPGIIKKCHLKDSELRNPKNNESGSPREYVGKEKNVNIRIRYVVWEKEKQIKITYLDTTQDAH